MIIYKITNTINNKIYIGKTIKSLKERWNLHCKPYSTCKAIKKAIENYGKDNFYIEALDTAENLEELNKKEKEWIEKLNPEYNCTKGGDGGNTNGGYKRSPETIEKMRQSALKRPKRKLSEEHKEKLRKSMKGNKNHKLGIEFSIKYRDKILKAMKIPKRNIKILCLNNNKIYESIKEASLDLKIKASNISLVAKGKKKSVKGYKFSFVK